MKTCVFLISSILYSASCLDFYTGMFKRNDFLVAQDTLYQEKTPFRFTYAKYGRLFKCPITYIRVVDRLGVGRGPHVQITRGGLQHKYVTLRIVSMYNQPISVNIYVGCANNKPKTTAKPIETTVDLTTKQNGHDHTTDKQKTIKGNGEIKPDGFTESTVKEVPNNGDVSPTDEGVSPSGIETSPSGDETSPNGDETSPSGDETSPNSDETSPNGDETSPSDPERRGN